MARIGAVAKDGMDGVPWCCSGRHAASVSLLVPANAALVFIIVMNALGSRLGNVAVLDPFKERLCNDMGK